MQRRGSAVAESSRATQGPSTVSELRSERGTNSRKESPFPLVKSRQEHGAVLDRPDSIVDLFEPDHFAFECVTDENSIIVPSNQCRSGTSGNAPANCCTSIRSGWDASIALLTASRDSDPSDRRSGASSLCSWQRTTSPASVTSISWQMSAARLPAPS